MSIADNERPNLLLVDDDLGFCEALAESLESRGYAVDVAHTVAQAIEKAHRDPPEYAVVDLKMPGVSGLELVKQLKALDDNTRILVLTGFASIATAVEAIKLGATHYLAKPADADDIIAALHRDVGDASTPVSAKPISVARLEWEHIQRVLAECGDNVSETARRLGMHRRTLQRKLFKRPART